MFDIGWSEIMVIVAVAIIVVGPKDIPKLLRTIGKYVTKARSMVRDVQSQIDEVANISELKEEAEKMKNMDFSAADETAPDHIEEPVENAEKSKDEADTSTQKSETSETSEKFMMK